VIACDPYVSEKRADDFGVKLVPLEDIVRYADIITVHTPLNDETEGMITAEHFGRMKDGVIIVNCARGGIIDEAAMLAALESGKAAGAAFDVWSEEPPQSEVLKAPHRPSATGRDSPPRGQHLRGAEERGGRRQPRDDQLPRWPPLENAVNIPRFDPDLMEHMKPFLGLIGRMGEFVAQIAPPNPDKVTFIYNGKLARYDCAPLTVCGLAALLQTARPSRKSTWSMPAGGQEHGDCRRRGAHHRVGVLLQFDHPGHRVARPGRASSPPPSSRGFRKSSRCAISSPTSPPKSICW
jgi:D-3-phosphoglycerate dehydrogenase / 2-oxoglutarate reductase